MRIHEKSSSADTTVNGEEGEKMFLVWSWDSPAVHGADDAEEAVSLQPREVIGNANSPLACGGDLCWSSCMPERRL